jgi:hypothetical protein
MNVASMKKNRGKFLLVLLVVLASFSCKTEEIKLDHNQYENSEDPKDNDEIITLKENEILVIVDFKTTPNYAVSNFTNLKYDKQTVLNIEWDDGNQNCLDGLAVFNGGLASNGINYTGNFFSDGCGNNLSYKGAVAVNGYNNYNMAEWGDDYPEKITYLQMKELISKGWDIENHSLKHISLPNLTSAKQDLSEMNQLIFDRIGYVMNTLVVPTNFLYYMKAASELGFISGTTQADLLKDGITLYPSYAWNENIELNKINETGFIGLNRAFNDNWSDTKALKEAINNTITSSSSNENKLIRIGTHNIQDIKNFANFITYINEISKDKLWVTSMRELFEFRIVKQKTEKKEKLSRKKLVILLNQENIKEMIRWQDLTLKIESDAEIASINIKGSDSNSFNLKTGLVNIFKQKRSFKSANLLDN